MPKLSKVLAERQRGDLALNYVGRYWNDYAPERGENVEYSDIRDRSAASEGKGVGVYAIAFSMGRDAYGTHLVSESNHERLLEDFPDTFRLLQWHNGDELCLLSTDKVPQAAIEALEYLADCIVYDDADLSRREYEYFWSCWDDYGRRDFARALERLTGADAWNLIPALDGCELDELYRSVIDDLLIEYGDEPSFDVDRAAELALSRQGWVAARARG